MISPKKSMSANLDDSQFEDLADQFANQIRRGDSPKISEYARNYPTHAETIRRLFPILEMMERNGTPADELSELGLLEAEMSQLTATPPLRKLGDYRIVREIGRGGMGIVFEAYQESLGRNVALKLLPASARFDARRQQRFQQEAMASAKLHHTNIVPVFGVGTHDDTAYIVMQYIDGQPLDSVLTELSRIRSGNEKLRSGSTEAVAIASVSTIATAISRFESQPPFPSDLHAGSGDHAPIDESDAASNASSSSATLITNQGIYWRNIANIGIQVASALAHAHSRKTLHRDIKPSNLLIDHSGCAWVTDFGLAKYFESPDLTRTGEVVGTLRYMSPEQLNGMADERSDIFALGLTLYEMAALKPAYDQLDRRQLMQQVLEASPRRLRTINRQVPRDLETIIQKCIASDPQNRYPDANSLAIDLKRFVVGQPVHARRINPIHRAAKWCRRRPAVASLMAALLLSLIAGVAGITWQWQKTADALGLANENLLEAQRQTKVAHEHFLQARESVNRFFTVVSQQRLLQEPGFQTLRKDLLQEALDYHKQFVAQYANDNELRLELAQSLYRISEIEGSLSASPDIAKRIDEPIQIFTKLIDAKPENPEYRLWLARCLGLKSSFLRRFDLTQSLDSLNDAIRVIEALRSEHPNENIGAAELAKNYQMLGLSYEQIDKPRGRTDRSLEYYTQAFNLRKQIQAAAPENLQNTIYLAETHRDLGITYRRAGEKEKAVEHYDMAMALLMPVVQEHPNNMMARNALGSIANTIGYFYGQGSTSDEYEKALSLYEISKKQYQALADQNPLVIQYQDGLARAALNAGGVHQVMGNLEKSLEYRTYASRIREELCELNPTAPHLRSSWAVSLNGVGAALRDMGRIDEAIEQHRLAHEQHLQVVNGDDTQSVARLRLIHGIVQMARTQSAGEMFQDAVDSIDSIEQFILPTDSQPFFSQGREYAIVASKVGQLDPADIDSSLDNLRHTCLEKSKSAFTVASQRGFDVLSEIRRDTAFKNFSKYPECGEIQTWLIDQFELQ